MSTILTKYIDENKGIFIDKNEWKALNEQYDKEFIKAELIKEIMAGNIRFPHLDITLEDAKEAFLKLVDYKCKDFQYAKTMTRYDYKYPIGDKYIAETLCGNDASNYFHQDARSYASGHNDPSPQEQWKSEHYMNSSLKGIWTLKMGKLDLHSIRSSMAMRKYWASQFRPSMAKSIYEKFNAVDVLDFSSGWGDRLCGFYAAKNTKSYIGIDPNKAVYDNYFKQIDLYKTLVPEKKVTLFNSPAEDVTLPANCVDTVFTSPPYFCAETYTQDDTQSWVRYGEVDSWLEGFMYRTLDMVWKALTPSGHLIVNISDVHRKGGICHICDPMNDYIKFKLGGELVDAFGMLIGKRPASAAYDLKEGTCVEPIWAWKKTTNEILCPDWVPPKSPIDNSRVKKTPATKKTDTARKSKKKVAEEEAKKVESTETVVETKVEEVKPTKPKLDFIVDAMGNIDPRALGKLMIALKERSELTIVHGNDGCEDIVKRLCDGLGCKLTPLYDGNGTMMTKWCGRKKLVKCQPEQKPEFEIIPAMDFDDD